MTKNYAVLGSPITHSKSPIIHNAAFGYLGSDSNYSAFELADGLQAWLEQLDSSWFGLSLTMPLKEQALEASTRADSLAIAANSSNTLIRTENGWDAYNTDVFGIQQSLAHLEFRKVLVLGTGATARSAIVAMQELGKQVRIWGRNQNTLKQLALEFDISIADQFSEATKTDVVISTLPALALDEHLTTLANEPTNVLLDVAYSPWPSAAATLWSRNGKVISGLEMLIWQAVAQQRLFAGYAVEEELADEKELVAVIRGALSMAK